MILHWAMSVSLHTNHPSNILIPSVHYHCTLYYIGARSLQRALSLFFLITTFFFLGCYVHLISSICPFETRVINLSPWKWCAKITLLHETHVNTRSAFEQQCYTYKKLQCPIFSQQNLHATLFFFQNSFWLPMDHKRWQCRAHQNGWWEMAWV